LAQSQNLERTDDPARINFSLADGSARGWGVQTTNDFFLFGTILGNEVATPRPPLPVDSEVDTSTPAGTLYLKAQIAEFQQRDLSLARNCMTSCTG